MDSEYINNLFNKKYDQNIQKRIDRIDKKLNILFENLNYNDYQAFIKSNDYLMLYDRLLGYNENDYIITDSTINSLTQDFFDIVEKVIDQKIKSSK